MADHESQHPGGLTREHVVWAYRLMLDREPESEDVIGPKLAGSRDTGELRRHLMTSAEFRDKNRDYAHTNDRTLVIKELEPSADGVRLFVDLSDHVIGLNIVRGQYEVDEVRYMRSFDGLGLDRFTGNALFVGPTFYAKFSEKAWMSAAWSAQVAGHVHNGMGALDTTNFEQHRALLRFGYNF